MNNILNDINFSQEITLIIFKKKIFKLYKVMIIYYTKIIGKI